MHKKLLFFFLLLGCVAITTAQKIDYNPLYARAGFKAGVNYSNITGDVPDTDARIRVHLGAVLEYPITTTFYVQGELLYSALGYSFTEADEEQDVSLNYLSLPLVVKYFVNSHISLETGPQVSLLNSVSNDVIEDSDPFFNSFNDFDTSWVAGVGYKLESGLFFQLRYVIGISDISKNEVAKRNSVAQVSVGYLFKTKNNRRIIQQEEYQ